MTSANKIAIHNYFWTITAVITLAVVSNWVNIVPYYITILAIGIGFIGVNLTFLWREWKDVIFN